MCYSSATPALAGLLCLVLILSVWYSSAFPNITSYNVLVLMVEKSLSNRFDLVHIGPAIDIAQKVSYNLKIGFFKYL